MNAIAKIRQIIPTDIFDYQALSGALAGYRKPRDKITRLLADGIIIKVRKGLYCFAEALRREPISREYLANLIYGPSYVSLDYALSHHSLIPERVATVTSVTTGRSREFETPFGMFSYRMLCGSRYSMGAMLEMTGRPPFLIATPEKALADKVWTDKRFSGQRLADYEPYLFEDLRLDRDLALTLDDQRWQDIAAVFDSIKIHNLVRYLKSLRDKPHA